MPLLKLTPPLGVFTLTNSPDYKGHTYSCANWPDQWGIKQVDDWFKTPDLYAKHLEYLDLYLQGPPFLLFSPGFSSSLFSPEIIVLFSPLPSG